MGFDEYKKFMDMYHYVKDNLYLVESDASIGKTDYNTPLLLGSMASVLNGKILYIGEYGLGKTMIAETLSALTTNLPRPIMEASSIKGNPEVTYETMIGRPDLGDLNQGKETIRWSGFVYADSKIIDEINRIPPNKQNVILTGMQNNSWSFMNEYIRTKPTPWFTTKNYKDAGNTEIIPPIMDRLELCVESKFPGVNKARVIRYKNDRELMDYHDIIQDYNKIINTKGITYKEFKTRTDSLKHTVRQRAKQELGIELLTEQDINNIQQDMQKISFDRKANQFLDVVVAELGSCVHFGQKRVLDICPSDCHYTNYACFKTQNGISIRTNKAIDKYAKAMAWITGKKNVTIDHIQSILPYTLWHKLLFHEKDMRQLEKDPREGPLQLYVTNDTLAEVKKRAIKIQPAQEEFIKDIMNGRIKDALAKAKVQDHPVFRSYEKGT